MALFKKKKPEEFQKVDMGGSGTVPSEYLPTPPTPQELQPVNPSKPPQILQKAQSQSSNPQLIAPPGMDDVRIVKDIERIEQLEIENQRLQQQSQGFQQNPQQIPQQMQQQVPQQMQQQVPQQMQQQVPQQYQQTPQTQLSKKVKVVKELPLHPVQNYQNEAGEMVEIITTEEAAERMLEILGKI